MSVSFELTAEQRNEHGKGASRRLRRLANKVPGVIYGGGEPAVSLQFDHYELIKALEHEAFYSHILQIKIDGKKQQAVLKDLQRHPYKPRILHMDLLRITGKEKIHMHVPLHFLNGDNAPGVKESGGLVSHLMNSVEVICMPGDLPEYIEVDLANLKLDESIHLSQLKLPKGVQLAALAHGHDDAEHNLSVASIHIPRATIEEETTTVAASEVPAAEQTATPAATEAKPAAAEKDKGKDK